MSKILSIVNGIINQYQEEIHNKNPSISLKQLEDIWKTINDEKDLKHKSTEVVDTEKVKSKKKKDSLSKFFCDCKEGGYQRKSKIKIW